MMNPEIEKAIEQLDAKIAALERARDTLIETFCPPDSPRRRALSARLAPPAETVAVLAQAPDSTFPEGVRLRRKRTRKDIVAEFIRQYGPSTRADILAGTGIPPGSVAFVLNDKARFFWQDGKWYNVGEAPLPIREGPSAPEGRGDSGDSLPHDQN